MSGWAQVNGAKLVTKDEKENLDDYYVRNASLWLDFKIVLMTLRMMGRSYLGSAEALADLQQVEAKRTNLAAADVELLTVKSRLAPLAPSVNSEPVKHSA
jgi:Bacterial sugar transferase